MCLCCNTNKLFVLDEPVSPPTGVEEARGDVSAAQANQDRLMGMHAALQAQLASQLQQQQAAMAAAVAAAAAAHHHHQNNNVIGQYRNTFNSETLLPQSLW